MTSDAEEICPSSPNRLGPAGDRTDAQFARAMEGTTQRGQDLSIGVSGTFRFETEFES